MVADIRVHIDTFEYTRIGLKTKEPINLQVGQHNRVVLVRPERVRPRSVAYAGFRKNSSFPTPAVLLLGLGVALDQVFDKFETDSRDAFYQVYRHTDATGEEEPNKLLSERRARAVSALLTGDAGELSAIAAEESWSLEEQQSMLRLLRCDPGPIDGEEGVLTQAATRLFQREYTRGVFCRHIEESHTNVLQEDGVLGPATSSALLEALIHACSPRLPQEALHPTHPVVGCSEFNRIAHSDAPNRRASLVVLPELGPHHANAPCTIGSVSECPLDDRDAKVQCLWYREHIWDDSDQHRADFHFDPRWKLLPNGRWLLSALTTCSDEQPVEFQVWRTGPARGPDDVHTGNLAESVSDVMLGVVRAGVAQVVWKPDQPAELDELQPHADGSGFSVLVFTVKTDSATILSQPPGEDLSRIEARSDASPAAEAYGVFQDAFGRILLVTHQAEVEPGLGVHPLTSTEAFVLAGSGAPREWKGSQERS